MSRSTTGKRASTVPSVRPNCSRAFSDAGSFKFNFSEVGGTFPGKIDVHQIGTGFGGQFWMSNTHRDGLRAAWGTWTLNRAVGPWARVFVHLPVIGARTQQARYEIDLRLSQKEDQFEQALVLAGFAAGSGKPIPPGRQLVPQQLLRGGQLVPLVRARAVPARGPTHSGRTSRAW